MHNDKCFFNRDKKALIITHLMADGNLERMLALLHPQAIYSRLLFLSRYETHVDRKQSVFAIAIERCVMTSVFLSQ